MLDTVIISWGAFVLKAAFMRETNSNVDSWRAAHFFVSLKKKGGGRDTLFAYRASKPPITCHTGTDRLSELLKTNTPAAR